MNGAKKVNLTGHIQLSNLSTTQEYESDTSSESEMSRDTMSITHTMTMTNTHITDGTTGETIGGNPKNWEWGDVQKWLKQKGLPMMIQVFAEGSTDKDGTDGAELLTVTLNKIMDDAGAYRAGEKLNIASIEDAENSPVIEKFFRELTKLQLKANESSSDFTEKECQINDVIEMKRRIYLFIEKWDRILWIDGYVETNGKLPTDDIISEELGVSISIAQVYLHYHENIDRVKGKDVDELLLDFNVYNDCVIWWFVIVQILTTVQTKAIWLLFNKVAELTPGNVAIELLDRYKFDLTRFDAAKLDQLAQNIVIGSQYPVCAALRMSKWFMDIADYDVARGHVFEAVSESFIEAAFDYLDLIESDHMATVILEVKSDIDNMNAFDMALEYELTKFVSNQRVERVTTSIMNDFEFLRPINRDEAFQIDPLSVKLIWRKMFYSQFYFTPLGTYCCEVFLYFLYLSLFTYLSILQFRVFDAMSMEEFIFWIFNAGYVANELQSLIGNGIKQYFSETQNYFDTIISLVFIASICLRLFALYSGEPCETAATSPTPCWSTHILNVVFVILWGIATITLWLRIINFCILSHSLGPMVTMIFKMMGDIGTFFEIMIILFVAFSMCLMFILGDVLSDFQDPLSAAVTLFRALLGDFEFDALNDLSDEGHVSAGVLYFGYSIMLLYLVIGSLVLLNLLIAMMAKTFDTIEEDTTSAIIFARFQLALDRDTTASFMPPPLNVFAMAVLLVFYLLEFVINVVKRCCCFVLCCCCNKKPFIKWDLAVILMPTFMKERKLELDDQILYNNCHMYWTINTNKGATKCKIVKYKGEIGQHYVRFYNDQNKAIKVSVSNSVEKKHQWQLDLFDLHRDGDIDFAQFDSVFVTSEWTSIAHKGMSQAARSDDKDYKSPYWICGFCRGYVKGSKISVKRLGYEMNVGDIEMKIINKVSPDICSNCYRVRLERDRGELVWEIISYWVYKVIVAPCLFSLFFFSILLGLLQDPDELGRAVDIIKAKLRTTKDDATGFIEDAGDMVGDLLDDGKINSSNETQKENKHLSDPKYCVFHYADTQLISHMNEMDEDNTMFDVAVRDDVWQLLADAKNDIDVFLLREKINKHILSLSGGEELSTFEFFDNFINMGGLKKNGGDFLWVEYFQPLALTIFERIQALRDDYIPLHLFKRYPFDLPMVLDDFTGYFDEKQDFNKQLTDISSEDIVDALSCLQCLNCINEQQRKALVLSVDNDKDDVWELGHEDSMFDKFVRYMREVQALFQDTRTIKNMLRDVSTAIVERGADSSVFRDQIHFLFEDIRNVTLATPFFNSMRTELKKGELKLELWTIRNTLYSLYFLSNVVRKYILRENDQLHVHKQGLLNKVYKLFVHDIIDPEGITDLIYTEGEEEKQQKEAEEKKKQDDDDDDVGHKHETTKSFTFAQKSTVAIGGDQKEEHDEESKLSEEERNQIILERMELFHKDAITASAIRDEVSSIFDKIQERRRNKITEASIDFYRRNGLKVVRLLQDDESLRYIFEQLSRYATFYPKQMKAECSVDLLKEIFYNTLLFGEDYAIDDETIPKLVRSDRYIAQLYRHLYDLYADTIENKFNSIIIEQTLEYMTLEDVLSMIMLYERTFSTLNTKIVEDGDTFVATHDIFCKFVDAAFDPDKSKHEWTNKTSAASDLFQSVLDEQQHFITLGQIRETVDKLMNDISAMKCGELTRIMNHLHKQFKNDNIRCKQNRKKYVEFLKSRNAQNVDDELTTQLTMRDDEKPFETLKTKNKTMRNPGLAFKHISKNKWINFVDRIADNFEMNVPSTLISNVLRGELHPQQAEQRNKGKKIIESILDNTNFDVIKISNNYPDAEEKELEEKYQEKGKKKKSIVKKKRAEVFDTALSFCSGRISLQQLFLFAKQFRSFLIENKSVNQMLSQYDAIININSSTNQNLSAKMKKHRIPIKINDFKSEYFGIDAYADAKITGAFEAEINYLFLGCENKYDLCHKIYPFWSGSLIKDIYSFMESTEQIQGNYELKEAEFGQLKHSLNVNDELAIKLFHIIRFKIRTLSWKQVFNYFKFLLKMKYNVQRAILKSKQAEDTTVSLDGIKLSLKIQLNDESIWLFNKVDSLHGNKVTWKAIRKYLKKMITVRDEMRDFFSDNERDRQFEEKQAEIVSLISENIENNQELNHGKQEKILNILSRITEELNELKSQLKNKDKNNVNLKLPNMKTKAPIRRQISLQSIQSQSNANVANLDVSSIGNIDEIDRYVSTKL